MHHFKRLSPVLLTAVVLCGCQSSPRYGAGGGSPPRNSEAARRHVVQGIEALERQDLSAAEAAFNAALLADAFCGSAHNNLGKVYFMREEYYKAAWQFQHAAKLLPYQPEPHNNLGLVLEEAGRLDEAVAQYEDALAHQPDNPVLLGNLVRARIRRGDRGPQMRELITDYLMKESRPQWRRWAKRQAAFH